MAGKSMIFIDGENFLARFEAMLKDGRTAESNVSHVPNCYLWHPRVCRFRAWDLLRVAYYTTCVGDDDKVRTFAGEIAEVRYEYLRPSKLLDYGFLVPRVFKKPQKSKKTASVDINISIDMLRHAYARNVEAVLLLTGDGDYIPLIEEVMRHGVTVYVAAFSLGCHPDLPSAADEFVDLDKWFFA